MEHFSIYYWITFKFYLHSQQQAHCSFSTLLLLIFATFGYKNDLYSIAKPFFVTSLLLSNSNMSCSIHFLALPSFSLSWTAFIISGSLQNQTIRIVKSCRKWLTLQFCWCLNTCSGQFAQASFEHPSVESEWYFHKSRNAKEMKQVSSSLSGDVGKEAEGLLFQIQDRQISFDLKAHLNMLALFLKDCKSRVSLLHWHKWNWR